MKTTEPITASVPVTKFIPGGQTLGQLEDGRKIFFWGALPGETVTSYQVTKQKSHYLEAIALEITHPSAHRIASADDCYLSTSPWQILDYDYELSIKRELLLEQFRQAGIPLALSDPERQPSQTPALPGQQRQPAQALALSTPNCQPISTDGRDLHYRNKMEYALYYDHSDEKIHLAFHARGSHRKIPVAQSSIERPEIWAKATTIVAELNRTHADARAFQSLLLRCDQQGTVSGGLYENHRPHPVFDNLSDTLLGRTYSYSPNGFFQINLPVYEAALRAIAPHITTSKVLDLYSGVGSIGLSVASGRELTLVECDASAYRELEKNAAGQHTTVLAKSEDALDFITGHETVILDPPRAGCHAKLLQKLLEQTPPTVIYLSCNPATQARDLAILLQKYHLTAIQPFNFFPRTPHLENLAVLNLS